MAEETPGNLGAAFGGFALGRATSSRRTDETVDRLNDTLDKFSDTLQRLISSLEGTARGTTSSGPTQQAAGRANGGGASFGGAHSARSSDHAAGPTAFTGGPGGDPNYSPSHRGNGGGWSFGGGGSGGGGGAHSAGWGFGPGGVGSQMVANAGGPMGIAKNIGAGALGATALYTMNHAANQYTTQTLSARYAIGGNWKSTYDRTFTNNYTAVDAADAAASSAMMLENSGYSAGSSMFQRMQSGIRSTGALDPGLTQSQITQATLSGQSVAVTNRAMGFGMDFTNKSTREVANMILQKVPGYRNIKTAGQMEAALGPRGGISITLADAVRSGLLTADMEPVIRSEIRSILKAQLQGMSASQLGGLARTASTGAQTDRGEAAQGMLKQAGFYNTMIQNQRTREGLGRDTEAQTITGFTDAVSASTKVIDQFREALNTVLSGPLGYAVGGGSGVMASGFSSIMSKFGGMGLIGMLGGDGPNNMASSAAMYSSAGGDGPASMSSGAASYGGSASRTSAAGASTGSAKGAATRTNYGLSGVKPWVAAAGQHLGPKFGIGTIYGLGQRSGASDHPKGLALDFMCGKSAGDRLAAYARANHKKLNITYIIWRQRIWSINYPGWRQMEDRGSPTANHYDHVHISFLASPSNPDLGGLPAGGGLGGSAKGSGGGGGGLGQSGSDSDLGGSQFTGTAMGGAGGIGGYSEVAALGIGGGGMAMGAPMLGGSSGGGGGGRGGSMGGPGSAGSARIGAYNVLESTGNAATRGDLRGIMGKVDALALSEVIRQKEALGGWIKKQGWGYFKGPGEAAVAWDKDDYNALKTGSRRLNTTHGSMPKDKVRHAAYVLLEDKDSGAKFWQVSAHTVPGSGPLQDKIRKEQYAALANLQKELGKSGIPVVLAGDINDRSPNIKGFGKSKFEGIDHIMGSKGVKVGGHGYQHGGMSSDHPFAFANVQLPGQKGGGGVPKGNGGTPSQNMALGRAMAAQRGWTGNQWDALRQLWMHESGWRTNADNPTSSAYGIPQALTALHNLDGTKYMNSARAQIQWGLNYINNRYGNPGAAWNFWQKNNWYDKGAWKVSEDHDGRVHQGEMILPEKFADAVRSQLTQPGNRGGSGRGVEIVFQEGSIRVMMPEGATRKDGREYGRGIMDAIADDARIKALAEG